MCPCVRRVEPECSTIGVHGLLWLTPPTEIEIAQVDVRGNGLWIEGNGFFERCLSVSETLLLIQIASPRRLYLHALRRQIERLLQIGFGLLRVPLFEGYIC